MCFVALRWHNRDDILAEVRFYRWSRKRAHSVRLRKSVSVVAGDFTSGWMWKRGTQAQRSLVRKDNRQRRLSLA